MTYDEIVTEIRFLRLERDKADAKLLLRLTEIERDHLQVILNSGCQSFGQFVQEIVMVSRYEAFKLGLRKVGAKEALAIGSEATIIAVKLTGESTQYTAAIRSWVSQHHGNMPTRQTADRILHQVDPRKEQPQAERREDELARLRAEVAELRAENRQLKAELSRLAKTPKVKSVNAS